MTGLAADWSRLRAVGSDRAQLVADGIDDLPESARRWLERATRRGRARARTCELRMRGQIRLGSRWRPFTARQILAPPHGFIWAATAKFAGLPVSGFDKYHTGVGEMRWRLFGVVPVMSARGDDVNLSAAGRLAAEATVLLPSSYRLAHWKATPDPDVATAIWRIGSCEHHVHVRSDRDGRLQDLVMQRWGDPDGIGYDWCMFGVRFTEERQFGDVRIPTQFQARWWREGNQVDDGEFFRATVVEASFDQGPRAADAN